MANVTEIGEKKDFTLRAGDRWPAINFDIVDEEDVAISLAGATVLMEIKAKATDTENIKVLTEDDGFTVSSNNIMFDTDVDIPAGTYVYDLQITLSNGNVHTPFYGKIKVKQDVSD